MSAARGSVLNLLLAAALPSSAARSTAAWSRRSRSSLILRAALQGKPDEANQEAKSRKVCTSIATPKASGASTCARPSVNA